MDIDLAILELQKAIINGFDEYAPLFKQYERILHKEIKDNPNNIRAVSLLSMIKCELRKSTATSLKYLEKAYDDNKDTMNDRDFSLISTNLAYFYIEECANKEKIAKELLDLAVKRNSPFAQTYYALALLYYVTNDFEVVLPLFEKATNISSTFRYRYNYAICLNKCGHVSKSIDILKTLSVGWETHEYKAKAYFSLGVLYSFLGQIEDAKKVAFDLFNTDYQTFDIEPFMLADLMFSVNEFERCIDLYDLDRLCETSDWLSLYFYCLKSLNRNSEALIKLNEVTDNINNVINDCTLEDFDGNKKEYAEYINSEKERLNSVINAYDIIFGGDFKPTCSYDIDLLYGCYYIDCPRHSLDDIQNTMI